MLVLGGEMGAYDEADHPWLTEVKELSREAAADGTPCSGSASGTSWSPSRSAARWRPARGASRSACSRPAGPTTPDGHAARRRGRARRRARRAVEQRRRRPAARGRRRLAQTPHGELQAARFAPSVWGVQWHPEAARRSSGLGRPRPRRRRRAGRGPRRLRGGRRRRARPAPGTGRVLADAFAASAGAAGDRPARDGGTGHQLGGTAGPARVRGHRGLGRGARAPRGGGRGAVHLSATTADPDQAVVYLAELADRVADREVLLGALAADEGTAMRLLAVLGASSALGDHLLRHPEHWRDLRDPSLGSTRPAAFAVRARLLARSARTRTRRDPVATRHEPAVDALRVDYRGCCSGSPPATSSHDVGVDEVAAELADLAAGTLRAALAIARAPRWASRRAARLAVDRDGQVRRPRAELRLRRRRDLRRRGRSRAPRRPAAMRAATRLAAHLMRICSDTTVEGTIWPVDANLRPEGNGPLVRTLASHLAYYQRWAKTWEFQALLKARPVAGDLELGAEYVDASRRWCGRPPSARTSSPTCRRCAAGSSRTSPSRRSTGSSSSAPAACGTSSSPSSCCSWCTAAATSTCARRPPWRRWRPRRRRLRRAGGRRRARRGLPLPAHAWSTASSSTGCAAPTCVPEDEADLRRARPLPGLRTDPVAELDRRVAAARRVVRRLHEKLFYRPLLDAVAQLPPARPAVAEGGPAAAGGPRLRRPGRRAAPPGGADRGRLPQGRIQRTLLPVLLGWFADSADPDAGLLGFRQVSDALGKTPWYLRLLRDEGRRREPRPGPVRRPLAPDLLLRAPEAVRCSATRDGAGAARPGGAASRRCWPRSAGRRPGRRRSPRSGRAAARAVPDAAADMLGDGRRRARSAPRSPTSTPPRSRPRWPRPSARRGRAGDTLPTRFAVIGMGRFGGHELGYGSDADVLFVHEPAEGASGEEAARAATPWSTRCAGCWRCRAPTRRWSRRGPAAGGQAGPAGAHPGVVRGLLRAGRWSGRPGAAARQPVAGDAELCAAVHRADRPAALPGRGARRRRRARDPAAQGADGGRADAARRRPGDPPQAGPRAG